MAKLLKARSAVWIVLIAVGTSAFAHSGGTIQSGIFRGCHNNNLNKTFECHANSDFPGQSWSSQKEALRENKAKGVSPVEEKTSGLEIPKASLNNELAYQRSDWPHWKDTDGDCRDTRAEILLRENLGQIEFKSDNCVVKSGVWQDFYTNEKFTSASDVEIDHVVSLKEAHESGGKSWTTMKKSKFANDPDNLVVTGSSTNSSKGANNFKTWMPANRERACEYAIKWLKVKRKYELAITLSEIESFNLLKCSQTLRKSP